MVLSDEWLLSDLFVANWDYNLYLRGEKKGILYTCVYALNYEGAVCPVKVTPRDHRSDHQRINFFCCAMRINRPPLR